MQCKFYNGWRVEFPARELATIDQCMRLPRSGDTDKNGLRNYSNCPENDASWNQRGIASCVEQPAASATCEARSDIGGRVRRLGCRSVGVT